VLGEPPHRRSANRRRAADRDDEKRKHAPTHGWIGCQLQPGTRDRLEENAGRAEHEYQHESHCQAWRQAGGHEYDGQACRGSDDPSHRRLHHTGQRQPADHRPGTERPK
jgi:hypothetical protein